MKKTGLFQTGAVIGAGVFIFGLMPYHWLSGGGSGGMLPYYAIAFLVFLCTLLEGGTRLVAVISLLGVTGLLIAWDSREAGFSALMARTDMSLAAFAVHLFVILTVLSALLILRSGIDERQKAYAEALLRITERQYLRQLFCMKSMGVSSRGLEAEGQGKPYRLLQAMLNCQLAAAGENGIELRLETDIPGGLELNEYELSLILGTLLDNVVDACATLMEVKRIITLRLFYKPDYLVAQITYPAVGKAKNPDRKKGSVQAGCCGLGDIECLLARHNGLLKIEADGGMVKMNIALLINTKP